MLHLPRRIIASLAAMLLASCRSHDAPPPAATATPRTAAPALAPKAPPRFDATEEQIVTTVGDFYVALLAALEDPALATADVDACAAVLRQHLEPVRKPARELSAAYASLPAERRRTIHEETFRRRASEVSGLLVAMGHFTRRFESPESQPEFRRIVERALGAWAHERALWVVEGFGPEAVEELEGWATGREEGESRREHRQASNQAATTATSESKP